MTRMNSNKRSTLMTCLLVFGLLCSSATQVQAAKKKKKGGKTFLPQLEQEERTVVQKVDKKLGKTKVKVHVSYSTPTMDAFVNTAGTLFVQPKVSSQGDSVCGTLIVSPGNIYMDKSGDRPKKKGRKILSMTSSAPPSHNPAAVTLKLELEKGVKSTVVYTFNGKAIEVEMDTEDPREIEWPTRSDLDFRVPLSHDLPIDASMAKKKSATKDCLLDLGKKKWGYTDFAKSSGTPKGAAEIKGHWPGCNVQVQGKPGLGLVTYTGRMLFEGYRMSVGLRDKPSNKKSLKIEVVGGR